MIRVIVTMANGGSLERDYHVGTHTRAINNLLKIARTDYADMGKPIRVVCDLDASNNGDARTLSPDFGS